MTINMQHCDRLDFYSLGEKERTKEEKTLIIAQGDRTLSINIKDLNYKFELNINLQV